MRKIFKIGIIILLLLSVVIACLSESYYVGSSKSDVFHRPNCRYVDQIRKENLVYFRSREEAIKAGYRPCEVCKP